MTQIRAARAGQAHMGDSSRWRWAEAAACRDEDLDLFFPSEGENRAERDERVATAKDVCADCSVREQCLQVAMERHEKAGVWGGMTAEERQERRRRWIRAQKPRRSSTGKPRRRVPRARAEVEMVSALGAVRRLRALAALNYGAHVISRFSGVGQATLHRIRHEAPDAITRRVAEGVEEAYVHLSGIASPSHDPRPRRVAERNSWAPPHAWHGLDMDDPEALPTELGEVV